MITYLRNKVKNLIRDGFFHIMIGNVLVKMVAFFSSVVIVRIVDKASYAYLAYADNLYNYINLLSGLGLSTAIIKFCAPHRQKGENKYYFSIAMRIGLLFQFAASLIVVVIAHTADIPFPNARGIVSVLVLFPTMSQAVSTIQSYIRSQLENKLYAQIGVIQTVVLFALSVPLAFFFDVYGVAYARYLAMLVVILIGYRFVSKSIPAEVNLIKPTREEKAFFWKISISLMLANLFSMIMPINEMFLINNFIKDEMTSANYKVAILIPSQIPFLTQSVVVYLFPKIAQMSEDLKSALKHTVKVESLLFGITAFVCLIGYIITPELIRLLYGDRYTDAIEISRIYWLVYGINAGFRMLPMNILPAIGSTIFNSVTSVVSCIIHAALLKVLIGRYGILGAPYSLLVIFISSGIAYWIYLYWKCSVKRNVITR